MFKPELVEADADDDEATEDISIYRRVDDDDEDTRTTAKEITLEEMHSAAVEVDGTGTVDQSSSAAERLQHNQTTSSTVENSHEQTPNTKDADENGLDEACGGVSVPDEDTEDALVNGIPIEESLFEDDIDDLELEDLEIVD